MKSLTTALRKSLDESRSGMPLNEAAFEEFSVLANYMQGLQSFREVSSKLPVFSNVKKFEYIDSMIIRRLSDTLYALEHRNSSKAFSGVCEACNSSIMAVISKNAKLNVNVHTALMNMTENDRREIMNAMHGVDKAWDKTIRIIGKGLKSTRMTPTGSVIFEIEHPTDKLSEELLSMNAAFKNAKCQFNTRPNGMIIAVELGNPYHGR